MSGWKSYKLEKLCETISVTHNFQKDRLIFLNTSDIYRGKILHRDYSDINTMPGQAKKTIRKNDILFSEIRPANGRYAYIDFNANDYVVSTKLMVIRSNKVILPKFFYLFLTSKPVTNQLQYLAELRSGTFPQITFSQIANIEISLPSLPEQQAIAEVLSSLDDKIDLLHRQNKTLEGMAETLWRKMFIEDADPNWKKGKLGDILSSIESGRRPKGGINPNLQFGVPSIGAENIRGIGNYNYNATKYISEEFHHKMKSGKVCNYDVLIYKDGAYVGRKSMFACEFPFKESCVNEHVFILRTKSINSQIFLYFLLEQDELEQLNTNSAQPGLNQESMKSFEIIIPDKHAIEEFGNKAKEMINKIFYNSIQIRTLSKMRDTLLPKLMSGEVRVKV